MEKISVKDRLMLANQFKILESLAPEGSGGNGRAGGSAERDHYAMARRVFERGYEIEYDRVAERIYTEPLDTETCQEVRDILGMYLRLQESYAGLSDKTGVEPQSLKFLGFSGNDEGPQLDYTDFIINDKGEFHQLLAFSAPTKELDSHFPALPRYRAMLSAWQPLRNKIPLDRADIQRILAVRSGG